MLLIPYRYMKKDHLYDPDSVSKAGIKFKERKIYIIKLHQTFQENDTTQTNFVVLTNFSHTHNKTTGEDRYIKNTYGFIYVSPVGEVIKEFMLSKMRLVYATSTGYKSFDDYYKDEFYDDLGFTFLETQDNDPFEICIDDMSHDEEIVSGTLKIPDPRYYTVEQFEIDNDREFNGIVNERLMDFYGKDLYDDGTFIKSLCIDKQLGYDDSVKYSNQKGELIPVTSQLSGDYLEKVIKLNDIPLTLFSDNSKSCFKSYKFIYDSKLRYNIKDIVSYKDMSNYRQRDYLVDITDKLRKISKDIEELYGNIRLMYYFSDIEDSVEVIFDDEGYQKMRYNYNKNCIYDRVATYLFDKYERYYERFTKPYIYA